MVEVVVKTPPQAHASDISSADTVLESLEKHDSNENEISSLSPMDMAVECGEGKKHGEVLFSTDSATTGLGLGLKSQPMLHTNSDMVIHNANSMVTLTGAQNMESQSQSQLQLTHSKSISTCDAASPLPLNLNLTNSIPAILAKSIPIPNPNPNPLPRTRIRLKSKSIIMYPFFPGQTMNGNSNSNNNNNGIVTVKANTRLPKVLALCILEYLNDVDIYHIALVCKLWYSVAYDESMWE